MSVPAALKRMITLGGTIIRVLPSMHSHMAGDCGDQAHLRELQEIAAHLEASEVFNWHGYCHDVAAMKNISVPHIEVSPRKSVGSRVLSFDPPVRDRMQEGTRVWKLESIQSLRTEIYLAPGVIRSSGILTVVPRVDIRAQHVVITDENVAALYLNDVLSEFLALDIGLHPIVVPSGEKVKSLAVYSQLVEECLRQGVRRTSTIYSLGGGVINNLAGFVASTLYRGVKLVHIPTTMLAQIDGAVDTKQAVNSSFGKNLIGTHYYPQAVVVDPLVLSTLSDCLMLDGLAEFVKHAFCHDGDALEPLVIGYDRHNAAWVTTVITTAIDLKVDISHHCIDTDYAEMSTQYGHCVGHVLEHLSAHRISHGQAIAIGMCVSAEIGKILGFTPSGSVDTHYRLLSRLGLPTQVPPQFGAERLWEQMCYDKSYQNDTVHMGFLKSIGTLMPNSTGGFSHAVDFDAFQLAIRANGETRER